jgi:hypothetical protein
MTNDRRRLEELACMFERPPHWLARLFGKLRLVFGRCPRCNSDGPYMDNCGVCRSFSGAYEGRSPTAAERFQWWYRFMTPAYRTAGWSRPWERPLREEIERKKREGVI